MSVVPLSTAAQNDRIIFRNGREADVNIIQVNDRQVIYSDSGKKGATEYTTDNTDIYMLRFAKRGNVYITKDGKRVTGENTTLPKDADIVYLVSGRELPAYELRVTEDRVTFLPKKNKNKKVIPIAEVYPRSDVFMIKYSDGTTDVLTDITLNRQPEPTVTEKNGGAEQVPEDELEVVFHNVQKGETLSSIASRYNVAIADIVKWNDLPASINATSRLRADMQLMIYVSPDNRTRTNEQ